MAENYAANYESDAVRVHRELVGYVNAIPADDSFMKDERYNMHLPAIPEKWEERVIDLCLLLSEVERDRGILSTCSPQQLSNQIIAAKIQNCEGKK